MNNSSIHKKIWFHLGIISIPYLSFINVNFFDSNFIVLKTILIAFLITIALIFLLTKSLSLFAKKINHRLVYFVTAVGLFSLFYLYDLLRNQFQLILPQYKGEISFVITILIFFFFYFFSIYRKNFFFIRFFTIYFIILFLFNLSSFVINFWKFNSDDQHVTEKFFSKNQIAKIKQNNNKNIYYVIIDAATSLDKFDEIFNTNYYENISSKYEKYGYKYIANTKSSYQQTRYTFTSIFYLSYFLNNENYKTASVSNLYPAILKKNKVNNVPLVKTINSMGYKFKWIGNYYVGNCEQINVNLCINSKKEIKTDNFVSYYALFTLLERSPIIPIYNRIKNFFYEEEEKLSYKHQYKENDSINNFLIQIKNYDLKGFPHLFLIHHLAPHQPHIYNSDCSYNQYGKNTWEDHKKNYDCTLKRVDELIKYVEDNDPEAIVIIQSDHGVTYDAFSGMDLEPTISVYDMFNLIKINTKCKKFLTEKINQPNAMRLALSCAANQEVKLLEKKSFKINFEKGNASIGGSFSLKEIKTFKDEMGFDK
tara:strand:+ start:344 stop:1954 length:1611 start_codon:yes stop_codon:yes gene_type:complete